MVSSARRPTGRAPPVWQHLYSSTVLSLCHSLAHATLVAVGALLFLFVSSVFSRPLSLPFHSPPFPPPIRSPLVSGGSWRSIDSSGVAEWSAASGLRPPSADSRSTPTSPSLTSRPPGRLAHSAAAHHPVRIRGRGLRRGQRAAVLLRGAGRPALQRDVAVPRSARARRQRPGHRSGPHGAPKQRAHDRVRVGGPLRQLYLRRLQPGCLCEAHCPSQGQRYYTHRHIRFDLRAGSGWISSGCRTPFRSIPPLPLSPPLPYLQRSLPSVFLKHCHFEIFTLQFRLR